LVDNSLLFYITQFKEVKIVNIRKFCITALILVMLSSLVACGGSTNADNASSDVAPVSSTDEQKVVDQLSEEAEAVPQPAIQEAASEVATDSSTQTEEEKLLGDWTDINDETRLVKVSVNGSEYTYTDPDGSYKGTFKDGILTIKISEAENDTAKVFIDSKSGNLVTNYQGDIYEFTRKVE
jgi:hypothetical protein